MSTSRLDQYIDSLDTVQISKIVFSFEQYECSQNINQNNITSKQFILSTIENSGCIYDEEQDLMIKCFKKIFGPI